MAPRMFASLRSASLFAALLGACSHEAAVVDSLPLNAELAPSFLATSSPNGLGVSASLFDASGHQLLLPNGASLVAVVDGRETALPRLGEGDQLAPGEFQYAALLAAPAGEDTLTVVLHRPSGAISGSTALVPAPFDVVEVPASLQDGQEVALRLSRAHRDGEKVKLIVGATKCNPPATYESARAEADRVFFTLEHLGASDACDTTINVEISRDGVLDPAFARDFAYQGVRVPSRFGVRQLRSAKSRVTPK